MKICQFCGTENQEDAKTCSSCGANEFKHKCENCETVFQDGLYCPKCGVRVGQKKKKCPRCSTVYFSNFCPNCGYKDNGFVQRNIYPNPVQPIKQKPYTNRPIQYAVGNPYISKSKGKKKRKTWLWVLGWIFMFPMPLSILLIRDKTLKLWAKIPIMIFAWILYFMWIIWSNQR